MSIEVKIPAVGESISSGVLASWLKKDGDLVHTNDPLFSLETDKVTTEVVALGSGRLSTKVKEGDEVKIGQIVAIIEESKESPMPTTTTPPVSSASSRNGNKTEESKLAVEPPGLSPAVRRLIEDENINVADIRGTGKGGRITKEDVFAYLDKHRGGSKNEAPTPPLTAPEPAAQPAHTTPNYPAAHSVANNRPAHTERETRKRLSPLRKKIAAHLVNAQHTAAILTTFNECDMSAVMELRKKVQDAFVKRHNVKLGFMSFFTKAVVEALKTVPAINGRIDGDDFVQNHFYDIGVAVGTDKGLIVPVIRDADQKSFAQIEKDLIQFATKAREGKIAIEDLQGGAFTISNGGVYGSLMGTPILNPPQSGILGMHNIVNRPVAVNDQVVIRPMMYLALSYDHRVVDGKEAATFLVRVKQCIEDPSRLLLEV